MARRPKNDQGGGAAANAGKDGAAHASQAGTTPVVAAVSPADASLGNIVAGTMQSQTTTAESEANNRKSKADDRRDFGVISPLKHDGGTYEIGGDVELTRAQFLTLKASGVVAGDWPED